jgi:hypothetical protein
MQRVVGDGEIPGHGTLAEFEKAVIGHKVPEVGVDTAHSEHVLHT